MGRQKTSWVCLRRDGGSPGCRGGGEIIFNSFFRDVAGKFSGEDAGWDQDCGDEDQGASCIQFYCVMYSGTFPGQTMMEKFDRNQ